MQQRRSKVYLIQIQIQILFLHYLFAEVEFAKNVANEKLREVQLHNSKAKSKA